jgi:hypothetical protein
MKHFALRNKPANLLQKYLLLLDQYSSNGNAGAKKHFDHETIKLHVLLITTYLGPIA